jgi:quercetin dioxygenase-like cupin family protein
MEPIRFTVHRLADKGRALPADTDHLLARTGPGALLLVHVPPGEYPYESHRMPEFIVCVAGRLVMDSEDGQTVEAATGDMVEIPPGLCHRFAARADAVLLTVVQQAAP